MKYDCVIIGAGLSGLAAGIRLAMFDKKVLIVEKHSEVGGLNSFYVRKDRRFDVGLHAMTNYQPKGVRSSPLGKLLKQLRFRHEEFQLCEQLSSEIRFPEHRLKFSNDFSLFETEVADQFPNEIDGFRRLMTTIREFDELNLNQSGWVSTKSVLQQYLNDRTLIDMIFCPLMYYGNAGEDDMDFYQFVIMFKSIFFEGFAKPLGGMFSILGKLVEKYRSLGGELRLSAGVQKIHSSGGKLSGILLETGDNIDADKAISSIGYLETLNLVEPRDPEGGGHPEGQVSFMESIFVLDLDPKSLGYEHSIVFFSTQSEFKYRVPDDLIDLSSGVLCCPNNFDYPEPLSEGMLRLTNLANFRRWNSLKRRDYLDAKKEMRGEALKELLKFFPEFGDNVVFSDTFTPKTILRYTGHLNGAVYGTPEKIKDGMTPVKNLYLCGTDQGFLGIIGATLSGISMANLHLLK